MITLRRRNALGLLLLPSGMLPGFVAPANAQDPMTIAAIASAASAALSMLQRSGDLQMSIAALNIKVDQILENQYLLLKAVTVLSDQLKDIQRKIERVPLVTLAVDRENIANQLWLGIAADLQVLQSRPSDLSARQDLKRHQRELVDLSRLLKAAAAKTFRPVELVFANKYLLNAIGLLLRLKDERRLEIWQRTELEHTIEAAKNAGYLAEAMTDANGIDAQVRELQPSFAKIRALLDPSPLRPLLPKDFGMPLEPKRDGDRKVYSDVFKLTFVSPPSNVPGKRGGGGGTTDPVGGGLNESRWYETTELRNIKTIAYSVFSAYAYGGKPLAAVDLQRKDDGTPKKEEWVHRAWSATTIHTSAGATIKNGSQSRDEFKGLTEIPDLDNGAPQILAQFNSLLTQHNALVEEEAFLLAVKTVARADYTLAQEHVKVLNGLKR
ncbi:MAG: hypothetical protein ACK4JB_05510 [Reyranella sp.]